MNLLNYRFFYRIINNNFIKKFRRNIIIMKTI